MKNTFHFSIDDVFESLIEVSDKNIPLKKHWFFKILYNLWKRYKIKTAIYLFYQKKIDGKLRTLKEVKSIKNEIKGKWIYFNFHGLDKYNPPFSQSIQNQKKIFEKIRKEIIRFAGKKNFSSLVRLHYYSESFELSKYLKNKKVKGLFTTDKKVTAYKLPKKNKKDLFENGFSFFKNLKFIRTDFRVEKLSDSKSFKKIKHLFLKKIKIKNNIVIYTHEYELKKIKNIKCLNKAMKVLVQDLKFKNIRP
tara:strand:+ start:67 stop:813 length:747 start_codon:yes stop_codon:yes gene_type:complete